MSRTIRYKLRGEEIELVAVASDIVGLSYADFGKHAILREAARIYRQAVDAQKAVNSKRDSGGSTHGTGTDTSTQSTEAVTTAVVPDEQSQTVSSSPHTGEETGSDTGNAT